MQHFHKNFIIREAVSKLKNFYFYSWDYLNIYEEDSASNFPAAGPYCGNTLPPSYTSVQMAVVVNFVSDYIINDAGFHASYNCIEAPTWVPPTSITSTPSPATSTTNCTDCTPTPTEQPPPGDCGNYLIKNNIYVSILFK